VLVAVPPGLVLERGAAAWTASVAGLPSESWRPSGKVISDALARARKAREH